MVQFALYEESIDEDSSISTFHYTCLINSEENINKIIKVHSKKVAGKVRVIPLRDSERIPYKFHSEESLVKKYESNLDLVDADKINRLS